MVSQFLDGITSRCSSQDTKSSFGQNHRASGVSVHWVLSVSASRPRHPLALCGQCHFRLPCICKNTRLSCSPRPILSPGPSLFKPRLSPGLMGMGLAKYRVGKIRGTQVKATWLKTLSLPFMGKSPPPLVPVSLPLR